MIESNNNNNNKIGNYNNTRDILYKNNSNSNPINYMNVDINSYMPIISSPSSGTSTPLSTISTSSSQSSSPSSSPSTSSQFLYKPNGGRSTSLPTAIMLRRNSLTATSTAKQLSKKICKSWNDCIDYLNDYKKSEYLYRVHGSETDLFYNDSDDFHLSDQLLSLIQSKQQQKLNNNKITKDDAIQEAPKSEAILSIDKTKQIIPTEYNKETEPADQQQQQIDVNQLVNSLNQLDTNNNKDDNNNTKIKDNHDCSLILEDINQDQNPNANQSEVIDDSFIRGEKTLTHDFNLNGKYTLVYQIDSNTHIFR
jgi:hypothetical protein